MRSSINILMTGGGAPGAAGILHCLLQDPLFNIIVADANPEAVGKYLHPSFAVVPLADDPGFPEQILSLCKKRNVHVVMPLVTRELIPLATHKDMFVAEGVNILVSPAPSLEIANNKSRLYEFLEWRGIAVPAFRIAENAHQFGEAVMELGYPGRPVCFKPSVSNGSRGFRILDNTVDELDLLFNQKPFSAYIRFEEALRILESGTHPELLVSEYLPGEEYSVDCLAKNGHAIAVIPRIRLKMINGISVYGEFVDHPEIKDYCTQIIKELQLHGNIGIQVKRSGQGKFLLLEVNPRLQGTVSAALGAGVNLPALAVKQELGLPIEEIEMNVHWGTKFQRYWKEVFY